MTRESRELPLALPATATPAEAAAISAAVKAHLEEEAGADEAITEPSWDDRRWWFAGRLESVRGQSRRIPVSVPSDPWTAAARSDRF